MKTRRLVTFTVLTSFVFLALTGIVLFFSPQGRIAYWSGWRMLGLSREQYVALHTTFMALFLVVGVWHIVLNWKPIVNYLKDRTKKVRMSTPEFSVALALSGLFFVGTLAGLFPFQQFLGVGEAVKDYWEAASGSPPWGHAELSPLGRFCRGMEDFERLEHQRLVTIDCAEALVALREAGIEVEDESQQLIGIARANSTTPQALAQIVVSVAKPRSAGADEAPSSEPSGPFAMPYSGLGRLSLRQYAEQYEADLELALSILRERGVDLDPDARLRDEATRFGTDPEGIIVWLNEGARARGE
jgi:hypothetical protein